MTEQGENRPSNRDATPTDYIQSLHEANMRFTSRSVWAIVILAVIVALATIAQAIWVRFWA